MKRSQGIMTTTHEDLHGERMALAMLKDGIRQIRERYIPVTVEHDIRIPPVGRVVSGEVIELPDGEYGLLATKELFERTDTPNELQGDGRRIVTHCRETHGLAVSVDRSYNTAAGRELVQELSSFADDREKPTMALKKALEPVPTLMLMAGSFVLGQIAAGFFNKLGADAYDLLKAALSRYLKKEAPRERIFDFCLTVRTAKGQMETHILLVNPTPEELRDNVDRAMATIDEAVSKLPLADVDIARVVYRSEPGGLHFLYAVRSDGVPMSFESKRTDPSFRQGERQTEQSQGEA